jgi:hypothetical protein
MRPIDFALQKLQPAPGPFKNRRISATPAGFCRRAIRTIFSRLQKGY